MVLAKFHRSCWAHATLTWQWSYVRCLHIRLQGSLTLTLKGFPLVLSQLLKVNFKPDKNSRAACWILTGLFYSLSLCGVGSTRVCSHPFIRSGLCERSKVWALLARSVVVNNWGIRGRCVDCNWISFSQSTVYYDPHPCNMQAQTCCVPFVHVEVISSKAIVPQCTFLVCEGSMSTILIGRLVTIICVDGGELSRVIWTCLTRYHRAGSEYPPASRENQSGFSSVFLSQPQWGPLHFLLTPILSLLPRGT
jgi:hypothetical protein